MEIKKILWPLDFSEYSLGALTYVNSMSEKYGAEVHLLYVVEDVHKFDHFYGDADPHFLEEFQGRIFKKSQEMLDDICKQKLSSCVGYKKHVKVGNPANVILETIKEEGIDLVVMSTHGYGALKPGIYLGGVTGKVIKNSPVPVVAVSPFTQEL